MNRKELLEQLREVNVDMFVRVWYHGIKLSTDRVESYRGSYDSISLSLDEREINNKYIVAWLIDELENTDFLYGYKGGEYGVNEEAHIYVSPYGYSSGQYVNRIGFDKSKNECILYTTDL